MPAPRTCPMCSTDLTGQTGFLVEARHTKGRRRWHARTLICESCYRAGFTTFNGQTVPAHDSTRTVKGFEWQWLAGTFNGSVPELPPTPCAACGQLVVRGADPRLKRVTCSVTCSVSLTSSRNARVAAANTGSGQPCETCGEQITTGRADSRYCGSACRQKAYRRRARDRHAQP